MKIQCDEHGFSCGFAYVHFEQEANAKAATANLHNTNLQGKKIVVEQFKSKKEREEQRRQAHANNILEEYFKRTVFVNNLAWEVRIEHLEDFSNGIKLRVLYVVAMRKNCQSRGFGYVIFFTIELAEEALKFHGSDLRGRELLVEKYQTKWQRLGQEVHRSYASISNNSVHRFPKHHWFIMKMLKIVQGIRLKEPYRKKRWTPS